MTGPGRRPAQLAELFTSSWDLGGRRLPSPAVLACAAVGVVLLAVVAANRWGSPTDEYSYWLGGDRLRLGQPLYDPNMTSVTPYAYRYPPPLAQLLAPVTAVVSGPVFTALWTGAMFVALWWIAGRKPLVAIALVAFLPVAVEFWYRNVHLLLAAVIVLAIRRWPALFAVGAAVKLAPGLGVLYLLLRRRFRDAAIAIGVGVAILAISLLIGPDEWSTFLGTLSARGPADEAAIVAVPYFVRALLGLVLTVVAATLPERWGEPVLVVAIVVALPTLWFTALSTLVALWPFLVANRGRTPVVAGAPVAAPIGTT